MRRPVGMLVLAFSIVGCSSDSTKSSPPHDSTEASATDVEQILAAAARSRVGPLLSFRGQPLVSVQIIDRLGIGSTHGVVDAAASGARAVTPGEKAAISAALAPVVVQWVTGREATASSGSFAPVADQVVITLAVPRVSGRRAEVATTVWCGNLCGAGSTHVLAAAADGSWTVTGTTGGGFVS